MTAASEMSRMMSRSACAGARYSTSGIVSPTAHPVVFTGANPAVLDTPWNA